MAEFNPIDIDDLESAYGTLNAYQSACRVVLLKFNESQQAATDLYTQIMGMVTTITDMLGSANPLQGMDISLENVPDPDVGEFLPDPVVVPEISMDLPAPPPDPGYTGIDLSDIEEPSVGTLIEPVISINPGDISYASSMLTALQDKLAHDIEFGGTGLGSDIETQIFQRELERSILVHNDTMDRIAATWAKNGFELPNGVLAILTQEEEINYTNKRLDTSRDISIKQADLAQTNTHFAIEKGIALESKVMDVAQTIQQRIFDASREVTKAQVELYVAQMQRYKISVDVYTALVTSRIEQAKGLVSVYTSQVDAYKARVQAEAERVRALMEQIRAEVEVYKADAAVYQTISDVAIRKFEGLIRKAMAKSEFEAREWEMKLKRWEIRHRLSMEAMNAQTTVLAHLIAGLMSAVSAAASISGSGSTSTSTNN